MESVLASGEDSGEQELRRLELEFEKLQARNDTIHDRFFDESITKADYQRAKARCESEMNRVQEKIAAIKQRQTLNTDTQTLKPDIRAAITGIVSGRTADDDFYGHLLQQMTVYRDGRVEVALNLLPAKWTYVLDGLEKYRTKIEGHDASSVPTVEAQGPQARKSLAPQGLQAEKERENANVQNAGWLYSFDADYHYRGSDLHYHVNVSPRFRREVRHDEGIYFAAPAGQAGAF